MIIYTVLSHVCHKIYGNVYQDFLVNIDIFSATRRSRSDGVSHLLSVSTDLTDVTLVSDVT